MKQKEAILRTRPFNMANFSSGAGLIEIVGIIFIPSVFVSAFFVWTGFALPMETEDGRFNHAVLKRRLNKGLLPTCLTLFGLLFSIMFANILFGNRGLSFLPIYLWVSAFPTLGIYLIAILAAKFLQKDGDFGIAKVLYLIYILIAAFLLAVVSFIGMGITFSFT